MTEKKEGIRLSYSAIEVYNTCSEKFRLERILKLVPTSIATPLFLGSAFDQASEVIFKAKMKGSDDKYLSVFSQDEMVANFHQALSVIDYQGDKINITKSTKVKYSKADVLPELLEPEDIEAINKYLIEKEIELDSIEEYVEYFKAKKERIEEEVEIYNYIGWLCLYRKGLMMLDALKEWSDNNILEIKSIQNYFKIMNEENDTFSGLSDLEAILIDDPNTVVTIDLKTSSNPKQQYPDNCIETSKQLAIYSETTGNEKVGYLIVSKDIKKRKPRVQIRTVFGKIEAKQRDEVFEIIDNTLQNVKLGKFEKNTDACWQFGKCSMYDYCFKGDRRGLVDRIYAPKIEVDKPIE